MPVLLAVLLDRLRRGRGRDGRAARGASPTSAGREWRHAVAIFGACAFAAWASTASAIGSRWPSCWRSSSAASSARHRRRPRRRRRLRAGVVLPLRHAAPRAVAARPARVLTCSRRFQNLALGFSVALAPGVLWYGFIGCLVGTLVGMLPGVGPLAGISLLLPATFGLDATRAIVLLARHLLRRDVRRLDDVDPDAHPRRGRLGDDVHRRLRDGAQGPRGPGARHRRGRLVRRGHGQRGRAHAARAAARRLRAALRAAGVLRAAAPRPPRARLHELRLDAARARHGRARPAPRHDRHRPDERLLPLRLRRRRARRRHRHRARGRGALRPLRDPAHRGAGDAARGDPPAARASSCRRARSGAMPLADRARHRDRLPDRHHPRLGARDLDVRLLRDRAEALEAPGGVRQGRGRRRGGPGVGEQRRHVGRLRADAGARRARRARSPRSCSPR